MPLNTHNALDSNATIKVLCPKWQQDRGEQKDSGYLTEVKLSLFLRGSGELKQEGTAETEEAATCHSRKKVPRA